MILGAMHTSGPVMRLGILSSHPIQYQAPWFRKLGEVVNLTVYFAHRQTPAQQAAAGFGKPFEWDLDLLDGYRHVFLKNMAKHPNVEDFLGCNTPGIGEHIQKENFDAFVVTGWNLLSHWQAVRACRRRGVPVMVRGDSQLTTPRSKAKRAMKAVVYPWLLKQFDAFLIVGNRAKEYLLRYGAGENRMFFAPHFVDNVWFHERALASEPQATRAELGCLASERMVLFVGKFIEKKRPLDLVRALKVLRARGVRARGVFVGAGELKDRIRRLANQLEVPVQLVGFKNQTELPAIYRAADMLVLPSSSETWGLVVNEAMACGTPAVVSDAVGCGPDLVEEGMTGAIYNVGHVTGLADAILRAMRLIKVPEIELRLKEKLKMYSIDEATKGVLTGVTWLKDSRAA